MNPTYRHQLDSPYRQLTSEQPINHTVGIHPGLWLDKYIATPEREDTESRRRLVTEVASLSTNLHLYKLFYRRWENALKDLQAQSRKAEVKGRMIIGLGDESVLETSVTLHRTYGIPYIPGSALKGLAASYVRQGRAGPEWTKDKEAYNIIFGNTSDAGYITFFDALYIPDPAQPGRPLHPDIITVHHRDYYQNIKGVAPADWDSPTPIPFLSATGTYRIPLAAPLELPHANLWIEKTFAILGHALRDLGIGAKTSSGYGRMELEGQELDNRATNIVEESAQLDPDDRKVKG